MTAHEPTPSRSSNGQREAMENATDRHNLRAIQNDPRLQRILTRYRCMSEEQRARLERLMELVEELK